MNLGFVYAYFIFYQLISRGIKNYSPKKEKLYLESDSKQKRWK